MLETISMSKKRTTKKTGKFRRELTRFAEYMFTGGVWFWSGYVLIVVLDNHIGLFLANLIGNAVGITLNFMLERFWVFKTKRKTKLGLVAGRYVFYTALNAFILNYLILYVLKRNGVEPEIGQFIASAFFTGWNYFWYKAWVFKDKTKPRRTRHHA